MAACLRTVLILGLSIGLKTFAEQAPPRLSHRNKHSDSRRLPNWCFWM